MTRHPRTGLYYIHVSPSSGPHADIYARYASMEGRLPWVSVVTPARFEELRDTPWYQDPMVMFVQWCQVDPLPKDRRKAIVTHVYSEAMNWVRTGTLLPDHMREWERFCQWAVNYDAAFAHTPNMVQAVGQAGIPTYLLPLGWDAEAMGSPHFDQAKFNDLVFYGSYVGMRTVVLPFLQEKLGKRLKNISGSYGQSLQQELNASIASLYVPHSDVDSYSTWRLWQAAATSAATISEPGDTWPFMAGEHFYQIEKMTLSNLPEVAEDIRKALDSDLLSMSKRAYELAREFSTGACAENYLVPASISILNTR